MINILDGQTDELLAYLDGQGDGIYISDEIEQDINGLSTLRFTALSGSEAAVHLRDFNRILVPHDRQGWQEYVIYETEIDGDFITVFCIGSETAINGRKVIDPGKYSGYTLKQYVTLATSGTEWAMGNVEFAGTHTLTFDDYTRPYDFLKTVERAFDMELSFRVEVAGSRVTGRFIDVYETIGSGYIGKEFVNAKDLIGVQKKIHNDRIVTAFEVIGPKPKKGEPLRTFVSDEDAFQRWNYKGLHIVDLFTPDWSGDVDMTLFQLQAAAEVALKKRIDSVVEYTISVADLTPILGHEVTYLGDSVRIKDTDFNPPLYAEARIINVKRPIQRSDEDLVEKTYTIGEVVEYSEESILSKFKSMQDMYSMRVVRQATPPAPASNVIWIKEDVTVPFEVAHTYSDVVSDWVPTTATEIPDLKGDLPADRLLSGTVIPEDITFTGALYGATGTFSGSLQVNGGSILGGTNSVTIENGTVIGKYVDSVSTTTMTTNDGNYEVKETVHALGNRPIRRAQLGQQGIKMWSSALATAETFVMFGTQVTNDQIKALVLADLGIILSSAYGTILESNDNALTFEYPEGDNAYMSWSEYGVRQAYVGFGGNGTNQFTFDNKRVGASHTFTGPSHRVDIDTNTDGHTRIRGSSGPYIKFIQSSSTIQFRDKLDDAYALIVSAGHTTVSQRELKKGIVPTSLDALYEINTTPIRDFHYNEDGDWEPKRIGLIVDEAPMAALDLRGTGVVDYSMVVMAWKAIQQLSAKVEELEAR